MAVLKFWTKLFTESNGKPSLMRVQSFLTLLFAFGIIIYQVIFEKVYLQLDLLLIIAAFVPKSLQKFAEGSKTPFIKAKE